MTEFADRQTLDDLNLLGRYRNNSIFHLFDHVVTEGGRKLLEQMFLHPLNKHSEINNRAAVFQYFTKHDTAFPFTGEEFELMENYLSAGYGGNFVAAGANIIWKKAIQQIAADEDFKQLTRQVSTTLSLLNRFADFVNCMDGQDNPLSNELTSAKTFFQRPDFKWLLQVSGSKVLSLGKLISCNHRLRNRLNEGISSLVTFILQLDVYIAVAGVAVRSGFSYAQALPKDANVLQAEGLFHPTVPNAIGNTLALRRQQNVIFLTGANMAGKSTLMKSFGIAIYLAHMGFPVAAQNMEFSVKDALYSSVNVSDNIGLGYSHFYAEVLRVKKVAEAVAADQDLFVVFDELFKGTNVKDAYDATLAITEAFSENRNCFFVISTHITEVGDTLRERCGNFRFAYLPTVMEGVIPRYTYQLAEGITTDRHGMMIIENEGILNLLREDNTSKK